MNAAQYFAQFSGYAWDDELPRRNTFTDEGDVTVHVCDECGNLVGRLHYDAEWGWDNENNRPVQWICKSCKSNYEYDPHDDPQYWTNSIFDLDKYMSS